MNNKESAARMRGWLEISSVLLKNERLKALFYRLALILFLGGIAWSLISYSGHLSKVSYTNLALLFALTPLSLIVGVLRLQITAQLAGSRLTLDQSLRVTVLSAAANMLPVPAGIAVRITAIKDADNTYGDSAFATLLVAMIWFAVAAMGTGAMLIILDVKETGEMYWVAGGVAAIAGTAGFIKRSNINLLLSVFVVELFNLIVGSIRILLAFYALGVEATLPQAMALIISGVLGSMVGVVPSGLGVAEGIAAMLAAIIGIAPEAGFLAASLNRVTGWAVVGCLAWYFAHKSS